MEVEKSQDAEERENVLDDEKDQEQNDVKEVC